MNLPPVDPPTNGPVQLVAVGFAGDADLQGVLDEVDRLQGRGVLRLLDVLVLRKDDGGAISRVSVEGGDLADLFATVEALDPEALFGLLGDAATARAGGRARPGGALVLLLVEHRWARPFFAAVTGAEGVVLGDGFIDQAAQRLVGAEIAVFDEAARVIAAAHRLEAEAAAQAFEAAVAAEEAIAAADATRAAAGVVSVQALIAAGLIEQTAAEEAVDAIVAAAEAVAVAAGKVAERQAAAAVTPAELRVLRYLPTKMTFALIADRLGISREAARQRAERAYRVLGVHNRADAVTRARELGVIPKTYH